MTDTSSSSEAAFDADQDTVPDAAYEKATT